MGRKAIMLGPLEDQKYKVIKKLVERGGSKDRAAIVIGCTKRHVNRLIASYLNDGKIAFLHKNKLRKPSNIIDESVKNSILKLYTEKYFGFNFKHFTEKLNEVELITISYTVVKTLLENNDIISPRAQRKTRKLFNKRKKENEIRRNQEKLITSDNIENGDIVDYKADRSTIVAAESHPTQARTEYFGHKVQMDASDHIWLLLDGKKMNLHGVIDEATGIVLGLHFEIQETLKGYFEITRQMFNNYGIPEILKTDNRTVFEYQRKGTNKIDDDHFTQYGFMCNNVGIELITSSVPQSKGMIERLFNTLQDRLVNEMRLANITTKKEANNFLNVFLDDYNKRFASYPNYNTSKFVPVDYFGKVEYLLSRIYERTVDNGNCMRYNNKLYRPINKGGHELLLKPKQKVYILETLDGELIVNANDNYLPLIEIQRVKKLQQEKPKAPRKPWIPPSSHPWKKASFERYISKQKHRIAA